MTPKFAPGEPAITDDTGAPFPLRPNMRGLRVIVQQPVCPLSEYLDSLVTEMFANDPAGLSFGRAASRVIVQQAGEQFVYRLFGYQGVVLEIHLRPLPDEELPVRDTTTDKETAA